MEISRFQPEKVSSESSAKSEKLNLRQRYLLERDRIRQEIGDLNRIREKLGLSQRKLCQLLLVDPSAWTRWIKSEAPPHIYQALKWLLELKTSKPEITEPRNLESRIDHTQAKLAEVERQVQTLEREKTSLLYANRNTPAGISNSELTQAAMALEDRFKTKIAELFAHIKSLEVSLKKRQPQRKGPTKRKKMKPKGLKAKKRITKRPKAKLPKKRKSGRKNPALKKRRKRRR
jgi:transcriptional regulator with XRE-family HTH domain